METVHHAIINVTHKQVPKLLTKGKDCNCSVSHIVIIMYRYIIIYTFQTQNLETIKHNGMGQYRVAAIIRVCV